MLLRMAVFTVLALGVAIGGAVAWVVLAAPAAAPASAANLAAPTLKSLILVASHPLRAGLLVKSDDLTGLETSTAEIPPGASLDTPQSRGGLTGAMIRRSLGEGQPVLAGDVVHPGDHGFLSAVLGPNMRAVTVAVDAVSGTAGLIWPGDHVDLILTQAMEDPRLTAGHRVSAETVLADTRVIAVDQQMVQGQAPDGAVAPTNRTATLEVTSAQAERVLVAARLGKLSLSVLATDRSANAAPAAPVEGVPIGASPARQLSPALLTAGPGTVGLGRVTLGAGGTSGAGAGAAGLGAAGLGKVSPGDRSPGSSVTWAGDVSPALGHGDSRDAPVKIQVFPGGSESKEYHF